MKVFEIYKSAGSTCGIHMFRFPFSGKVWGISFRPFKIRRIFSLKLNSVTAYERDTAALAKQRNQAYAERDDLREAITDALMELKNPGGFEINNAIGILQRAYSGTYRQIKDDAERRGVSSGGSAALTGLRARREPLPRIEE